MTGVNKAVSLDLQKATTARHQTAVREPTTTGLLGAASRTGITNPGTWKRKDISMFWYETHGALVPSQDGLGWLVASAGNGSYFTGTDATGWEDSTWILNPFYELPFEGTAPSHDKVHSARIAREVEPRVINGFDLDAASTTTGSSQGYERRPPVEWQRRTWSEMQARFPQDHPSGGRPPCYRWFPVESFPANISLPSFGSLPEEDFAELIGVLGNNSSSPICSVYFADVFDHLLGPDKAPVYDTRLRDLPTIIQEASKEQQVFTPANLWPPDRSWLVYTDYDLWATKVSGSRDLIEELQTNPLLETLDWLPWSGDVPPN